MWKTNDWIVLVSQNVCVSNKDFYVRRCVYTFIIDTLCNQSLADSFSNQCHSYLVYFGALVLAQRSHSRYNKTSYCTHERRLYI
jgi:hypothetical protein